MYSSKILEICYVIEVERICSLSRGIESYISVEYLPAVMFFWPIATTKFYCGNSAQCPPWNYCPVENIRFWPARAVVASSEMSGKERIIRTL